MYTENYVLPPLSSGRGKVEFLISRTERNRYSFEDHLFSKDGHILSADYAAVLKLTERVNKIREDAGLSHMKISSEELYALGLMHEIFHHIVETYNEANGGLLFERGRIEEEGSLDPERLDASLEIFVTEFPPQRVYRGELSGREYLEGEEGGEEKTLEEMVLLWVTNRNPAILKYRELVDDSLLSTRTEYEKLIKTMYISMGKFPSVDGSSLNLIDFLRLPAQHAPESILDQLSYIAEHWQQFLGPFTQRLLRSIDLLREASRPAFPPGPGPTRALTYHHLDHEYEAFSEDTHWMPRVVLLAKSTLVWLDQLTRHYGRTIHRLDQIPDQVLDRLAEQGFNALWLIGLWERSTASKVIKRSCGNPEAEASAYSLKRYEIAEELGGWEALHNLKERCRARGIRLASDMVPNHTGIDGDWVFEHPDWFLQLPEPPYPAYTYHSPDLSDRPGISIHLEDHYYDRSDAALTFKWYSHHSGESRYIYHGNDGTSMPWNDTAQLDFLNPEMREALIQTILHVARSFPIIRFDAAMTLARKHIHRLWYPAPGSGGDIPSRSWYGMSDAEFFRKMPREFWREVVDRVAAEAPDTLLLAEAFWMMEGFFVRTLGMHRVYNSAFMNMLKNEENEKYKNTIKNTLSFEPEILKRFVNFMNNPDEDTAVAQFGDGDKYFGVCTMMVTMPGLPMFGHGQIEGYHEKYGMEYRKAYWNETPNRRLIDEHYRRIFPLMKRRYLFAESGNFRLYDLHHESGAVNHNVFVYTNRFMNESTLVAYNNAYPAVNGWIFESSPFAVKNNEGKKTVRTCSIAEGLGLGEGENRFTLFREQNSNLWFIRENNRIFKRGMFLQLNGYESQVYLDFYQVYDSDGLYRKLFETLDGRGVTDIELRKKEIYLQPVHHVFGRFLQQPLITPIRQAILHGGGIQKISFEDYWSYYDDFLDECLRLGYGRQELKARALSHFQKNIDILDRLSTLSNPNLRPHSPDQAGYYYRGLSMMPEVPLLLLAWTLLSPLEDFFDDDPRYSCGGDLAADLLLPEQFGPALLHQDIPENAHRHLYDLMLVIVSHTAWPRTAREALQADEIFGEVISSGGDGGADSRAGGRVDGQVDGQSADFKILEQLIRKPAAAWLLELHRDGDVEWYRGESLQELLWWLNTLAILHQIEEGESFPEPEGSFRLIKKWIRAEEEAEYQVGKLLRISERVPK
jgi:glycosidase